MVYLLKGISFRSILKDHAVEVLQQTSMPTIKKAHQIILATFLKLHNHHYTVHS